MRFDRAIAAHQTDSSAVLRFQPIDEGIHLLDLAKYLDATVEAARKEMAVLTT
ncbi:hypothetical protein LRP30_07675 [Bradyrhizobium sp. C-145]|uniref:hypothetical protein n=1 Tax=Bradyrhizobium sp. C-145 TaxID=574727 RepID=UPI00201B8773|nr:hypothetical protein [Bradyrhizobium sp. C-145]UQR65118.1 hypothetical protein LRP30_07675 [Bradyrhizobium sp. C-145]